MFLLGLDIGSSSIKVALTNAATGRPLQVVQSPHKAMPIEAPHKGWAEQDPELWWRHVCIAVKKLLAATNTRPEDILSIGIAYQMHGLVLVDKEKKCVRPAIIWCDSRAVSIGDEAFQELGEKSCLTQLLNSPGNFTAAKMRWVLENEPENFAQSHKMMLPGDYIAMKLTGEIQTTVCGLSEGMLWDFQHHRTADFLLDHFGLPPDLIPDIVPVFGVQGRITPEAARDTGLKTGTPLSYRAGDQPSNAMALNVLRPGEIAATCGTSGVVYGVTNEPQSDPLSRVNAFAHVNYSASHPCIGMLLCINGAGIQHRWVKDLLENLSYTQFENLASKAPAGADGLSILPFGNGAERVLQNKEPGAGMAGLDLNRHNRTHLCRATLEGIAFAFVYGMDVLKDLGLTPETIRAGNDNLFQSAVFSETIAALSGCQIEMFRTSGAIGAAKAAGVAAGIYANVYEAMQQTEKENTFTPHSNAAPYQEAYAKWLNVLNLSLNAK